MDRAAALAGEQHAADDDQRRPGDDACDQRLAEEDDGEQHGEERCHPHRDRRPRGPRVTHGEGEQDLGDSRREHTGEQERPDTGEIP